MNVREFRAQYANHIKLRPIQGKGCEDVAMGDMNKQVILLCVMMLLPLCIQGEVRSSSNFKMQADGLASAVNMDSSSYKLFSIIGDGRGVKLSSSSNFKLGSSVVYAIGAVAEDSFCFPVRAQNAKVVLICL